MFFLIGRSCANGSSLVDSGGLEHARALPRFQWSWTRMRRLVRAFRRWSADGWPRLLGDHPTYGSLGDPSISRSKLVLDVSPGRHPLWHHCNHETCFVGSSDTAFQVHCHVHLRPLHDLRVRKVVQISGCSCCWVGLRLSESWGQTLRWEGHG